jgi:hypothetical protein
MHGPADCSVAVGGALTPLAEAGLRRGLDGDRGEWMRLACATATAEPGLVLTWNHRLCDARGAMGVIAALSEISADGSPRERWWRSDYRAAGPLPTSAAARGQLARGTLALLDPLCRGPWLRPAVDSSRGKNPAAPIRRYGMILDAEVTARFDARQRAATGRFGETPFVLAAVAAALEAAYGIGADLLFPLAVDTRAEHADGERRLLSNCHGFMLLRLAAGLASRDLGEAGRALKEGHRRWLAADGFTKMSASLSWFPLLGYRLARAELGFHRAGIAASCLVANTGRTLVPERLFGAGVLGVDHAASLPGTPGLGVLVHRDRRGLGLDVIATGAVARRLPPERFAALIAEQLLERPFAGAPA